MNETLLKRLKYGFGLAGLAILVAYKSCPGSCQYLSGTLLNIDLTLAGAALMLGYLVLLLGKKELWAGRLIALALGGEVFLIGYQVVNQVFCPYCLGFAATISVLFLLHFRRIRRWLTAILIISGFALFLLGFTGQLFPSYAAQSEPRQLLLPSYGEGPVEVRLYTDYFCGPCQALEKQLVNILPGLVESGKVRLTLVDTPMHKYSGLYAQYFLYALAQRENSFAAAYPIKKLLYKAAEEEIYGEEALKHFLAFSGIEFADIDLMPTLTEYSRLIKEDKVNSTPRMVVVNNGGKESFSGAQEIVTKLKSI